MDNSGRQRLNYLGIVILALLAGLVGGALVLVLSDVPIMASETSANFAPLPADATTTELEARIQAVYQRGGASVVNITSRALAFDYYSNPVPQEGTGSGFFFDSEGHIVTNYHVVAEADELEVALVDGRSLPAEIVGTDPSNDLAVIKVELSPDEITLLPLGDSGALQVGQFVVAIGNPFGLERTLTVGTVSSLGRVITSPNNRFIGEAIQTDAPINPGNSGGPLFNLAGKVVGVNSAIVSPSGANAGIGFAIPARTVERVVPVLIKEGRYPHPTLGIQGIELTPQRVSVFERAGVDMPVDQGLLIVEVVPNGPADRAGIRGGTSLVQIGNLQIPVGGDIIVAINDQPVTTNSELIVYLETQTAVGETVQVKVNRDGQEQSIPVTLGELTES